MSYKFSPLVLQQVDLDVHVSGRCGVLLEYHGCPVSSGMLAEDSAAAAGNDSERLSAVCALASETPRGNSPL